MKNQASGIDANCSLGPADMGKIHIAGNQCGNRGGTATNENGLYAKALVFEETLGYSDTKRQLVVPSEAYGDNAKRFLLLGLR